MRALGFPSRSLVYFCLLFLVGHVVCPWKCSFFKSAIRHVDPWSNSPLTFYSGRGSVVHSDVFFADLTDLSPANRPALWVEKTFFSLKWSGKMQIRISGIYTFYLSSSTAVRLLVKGAPIISRSNWTNTEINDSGTVQLNSGDVVLIEVHVHLRTILSGIRLRWAGPGFSITSIPISQVQNVDPLPPFISFLGNRYASLDQTDPDATTGPCQSTALPLPSGWTLATDPLITKILSTSRPWGKWTCFIANSSDPACRTIFGGTLASRVENDITTFVAADDSCRILISQPADKENDLSVPSINSRNIILNGNEYGLLDGSSPFDMSISCDRRYLQLPNGWEMVSYTSSDLQLLLTGAFPFGGDYIVTKEGKSFSTSHPGSPYNTNQLETLVIKNRSVYRAQKLTTGCQRVIIFRPTTEPDTWATRPTITNFLISQKGKTIASIRNHSPLEDRLTCDNLPVQLPPSFSLAGYDKDLIDDLQQRQADFGSDCLVFGSVAVPAPGKEKQLAGACAKSDLSNMVVGGAVYYWVKDCSVMKRILIESYDTNLASPNGSNNEVCGICHAWGNLHVQSLSENTVNLLSGNGNFLYMAQLESDGTQVFSIYANHVQTIGTTAINQVNVVYKSFWAKVQVDTYGPAGKSSLYVNGQETEPYVSPDHPDEPAILHGRNSMGQIDQYIIILPNLIKVVVQLRFLSTTFIDMYIHLPSSLNGLTSGICGTCPGPSSNRALNNQKYLDSILINNVTGTAMKTSLPTNDNNKLNCDRSLSGQAYQMCALFESEQKEYCHQDICATGDLSASISTRSHISIDRQFKLGGLISASDDVNDQSAQTGQTDQTDDDDDDEPNAGDETCPQMTITNTVSFLSKTYASLDNAVPSGRSSSPSFRQKNYLTIPPGWEIAPDDVRSRALLTCYTFGSGCNILASGYGYTSTLSSCGDGVSFWEKPDCAKPLADNSRILIRKKLPLSNDDIDMRQFSYSFYDGASLVENPRRPNSHALMVTKSIMSQTITAIPAVLLLPVALPHAFAFGAWAKSSLETPSPSPFFSMTVEARDSTNRVIINRTLLFDSTRNDWQFRSADFPIPKGRPVARLTIQYSFPPSAPNGRSDVTFFFADHQISHETDFENGNYLSNPTFDMNQANWQAEGGDVAWDKTTTNAKNDHIVTSSASGSVRVMPGISAQSGITQTVYLSKEQASNIKSIYFRGDALAMGMIASHGSDCHLKVNITYDDTTRSGDLISSFAFIMDVWISTERFFKIPSGKLIQSISFSALVVGNVGGVVYFDNLYLTLLDCAGKEMDAEPAVFGDPHIKTFDSLYYSVYSVGDFILYQDDQLTLVTRFCPQGWGTSVCVLLMVYESNTFIQIERSSSQNDPIVTVNGTERIIKNGVSVSLAEVGLVTKIGTMRGNSSCRYEFYFPTSGHQLAVSAHVGETGDQWLQIFPNPLLRSQHLTAGLLGTLDGNTTNELQSLTGQVFSLSTTSEELSQTFTESWRILDAPIQPREIVAANVVATSPQPGKMITDFSKDAVNEALDKCAVVNKKLINWCVLDVLMTGDGGYVRAYAELERTCVVCDHQAPPLNEDLPEYPAAKLVWLYVFLSLIAAFAALVLIVSLYFCQKRRREGRLINPTLEAVPSMDCGIELEQKISSAISPRDRHVCPSPAELHAEFMDTTVPLTSPRPIHEEPFHEA